jgi:AcrR family transcriptional regulator
VARRLSPEARRAEIIDIAQAVIAEEGYRSLSLREVARRCGMSAPGLMHYFPDLPSLLDAVLAHRDEVDLAQLAPDDDASLIELLDAGVDYYAERAEETRRFDALEAEALDPSHPAHAYFATRDDRTYARLRPIIERQYDRPDDVLRLVRLLFDGMRLALLRDPEHADIRKTWASVRPLVVGALPQPKAGRVGS